MKKTFAATNENATNHLVQVCRTTDVEDTY